MGATPGSKSLRQFLPDTITIPSTQKKEPKQVDGSVSEHLSVAMLNLVK